MQFDSTLKFCKEIEDMSQKPDEGTMIGLMPTITRTLLDNVLHVGENLVNLGKNLVFRT